MRDAKVKERLVVAGPCSPEMAQCLACGGEVHELKREMDSKGRLKNILTFVCLVLGILLLGARASSQGNTNVLGTPLPLPTPEPLTLLQLQLDHSDPTTSGLSSRPLAATAAVTRTQVITALADTLITRGYPTANCGDALEMRVGYDTYLDPDGETLYSLVRFNLVDISPEATVHTATLRLFLSGSYDYPGHSVPITPHRISSPWGVDTVTWNSRPSYAEAYAPTWVTHGSGVWYSFDVTDLVRHWTMGTYPNYGLILLGPEVFDGWRTFAASETTDPPHLVVSYEQAPNFTLTMVPDTQAVLAGQNTSSILYLAATDGFSESTTLDIAGLPSDTTHEWSANPVTPTASTLLTITTAADTPRGTYALTITGTSASRVQTMPTTLRVLQPDFELSLQPSWRSVWSGEDALYTAHLTATDGFTAGVTLDVGGLPVNVTHAWSANPVTPTASTLLTITTAPGTVGGVYTFTITGTAGSLVHTAQAALRVSEPDFEISLAPSWGSVGFGDSVRYTTYITGAGGFSESVALKVGGLPPHTIHKWSANPVTPTTNIWLTITTAPDTPGGLYTLTVTGTAGSLVHTAQATLYVSEPDFELSLVPSWRSMQSGESARYTAFLTATGEFSQSVALDVGGLPPGTTYGWSANPVTPTTSVWLTITTLPDTLSGVYTFTITGTAGSLVHTAQAGLRVSNPDFELRLAPPWLSVGLGEGVGYTAFLTATDGFSESVMLDVGGLPPNSTHQWSANPVMPTASTWLFITTTPDTPRGVYTLTITGTSASRVRAAQATLQVSQPDFELSLRPLWQSVWSGEGALYTAHLTATDGFTAGVTLDVGPLPPNTTHKWSTNPVTPTSSAQLTITTAPETPGGVYTFTITGTAGSLVHTVQAALHVSEPDFELKLVPSWRSVGFGDRARYTVHLTATGRFSEGVALAIGGLPSNTTYAWSANPVTPTASTWLTITTSPDTPGGLHTLTVTGTAGNLVHTSQATLHVAEPDFELSLVPPWRSVRNGESAQYTASLTATGGFSSSVILDVEGLPSGAAFEWSANPVRPTTSAVLSVTAALDTSGGAYTFTITATAGGLMHSTRAVLHVVESDFELQLEPSLRSVVVGESTHYTAHLVAVGGFSGGVTLDVSGAPSNAQYVWGSNPVEPTASAVLTIATTSDTPTGTHTLTVTGTSGDMVHSAYASLTVMSTPSVAETVYLPLVLRGYSTDDDVMHHSWREVAGSSWTSSNVVQDIPASRIALVIGVSDYEHMGPVADTRQEDKTHDLGFPVNDAFDLEEELARSYVYTRVNASLTVGHVGTTSMTVLVDRQATKGAIHSAIINWMDPRENESTLVMISFSGHGMYAPDEDGDENDPYDEFIVPHDIDIDEEGHWLPETAISDDEFASWLGELESQQIVVFIDSCFAGGIAEDPTLSRVKSFSWRPAAPSETTTAQWRDSFLHDIQGAGRVVLAATAEEQGSWEFGALRNGAFTYYLVEALHSPSADANGNGWISAEEAYAYLDDRVDDYVWNHTSPPVHQNPLLSDGVSGEVDVTQPVSCDSCPVW